MFFAGVCVGMGGLLLFGYFFAKSQEKKQEKQLREMLNKAKAEEDIVNDEKGVEDYGY